MAYPIVDDTTPENVASYLATLPSATLLAAVDCTGTVRATAGSAVLGEDARTTAQ